MPLKNLPGIIRRILRSPSYLTKISVNKAATQSLNDLPKKLNKISIHPSHIKKQKKMNYKLNKTSRKNEQFVGTHFAND
jgi:hypothetical protein